MSAKLTVRDAGLARLRKDLEQLKRLKVTAGVQADDAGKPHPSGTGITFGELAAVHEYGSDDGHIPARPYLRTAGELSAGRNRDRLAAAISAVVDQRATPVEAMAAIGPALVVEIETTIDRASDWAKPLAPSTIRAKGHDRPLVDSLALRGINTWAVVDGDRVLDRGK